MGDLQTGFAPDQPGGGTPGFLPTTPRAAIAALREIAAHAAEWAGDYVGDPRANEFRFRGGTSDIDVPPWFDII